MFTYLAECFFLVSGLTFFAKESIPSTVAITITTSIRRRTIHATNTTTTVAAYIAMATDNRIVSAQYRHMLFYHIGNFSRLEKWSNKSCFMESSVLTHV